MGREKQLLLLLLPGRTIGRFFSLTLTASVRHELLLLLLHFAPVSSSGISFRHLNV